MRSVSHERRDMVFVAFLVPIPHLLSPLTPPSTAVAATAPMANTWKGVKRFYKDLDVAESSDPSTPGWRVLVDGRALRTNGTRPLLVPTRALAVAIASEFAMQGEFVVPATTPIYNIASSAIDNFASEDRVEAEDLEALSRAMRLSVFDRISDVTNAQAQTVIDVGSEGSSSPSGITNLGADAILRAAREADSSSPAHAQSNITGRSDTGAMGSSSSSGTGRLRDLALDYLETDTLCYRVDTSTADPSEKILRKRQDKNYDPLLSWFEESFGVRLGMAVGMGDLTHPDAAYDVAEDAVDSADPWLKAFYQQVLGGTKSTVLALALAHRVVDVDGACAAARVEEEFQIGEHGFVEDGHDAARAHLRLQVASAAAYLSLLPASAPPRAPNPSRKGYAESLASSVEARTRRVKERRDREARLVADKRAKLRKVADDEAAEEKLARDAAAAAAAKSSKA
jgi:chaperone required for assembly of F1-ATPase